MSAPEGNSNIVVEITDPEEFHCFRLILNPNSMSACCHARVEVQMLRDGTYCSKCGQPAEATEPRLEIMFHARSMVDLIHKCSLALCEWQRQTTQDLIERMTGLSTEELKKRGMIG
jgi:hypothetical protein